MAYRDIMDAAGVPPMGEIISVSQSEESSTSVQQQQPARLACNFCGSTTGVPVLKLCSGCHKAVYCSELCQHEDQEHMCIQ